MFVWKSKENMWVNFKYCFIDSLKFFFLSLTFCFVLETSRLPSFFNHELQTFNFRKLTYFKQNLIVHAASL